jgi:hypothetical protein
VEFQLIEEMKMKMHEIQFESIVNLIQMKLMKVICKMKSMMIKEFQHFVEFQLIEEMMMKMQMIQLDSIMIVIQTRLFGNNAKPTSVRVKRKTSSTGPSSTILRRMWFQIPRHPCRNQTNSPNRISKASELRRWRLFTIGSA